MNKEQVFLAYTDASGLFADRFQSIGIISGNIDAMKELKNRLEEILSDEEKSEIKFSDISRYDSPEYKTAKKFYKEAIEGFSITNRMRADILTWDTRDSRHTIRGRDDIENLGRMYYHLLRHIAGQWNPTALRVFVDENENVDFDTLIDCLNSSITRPNIDKPPLIIVSTRQLEQMAVIKSISEVKSHEEPLVQLADLFAGVGRFSSEKGGECCNWLESHGNPNQSKLPDFNVDSIDEFTKSDECRFQLIGELCKVCRKHRLGVNLHERKRLWTRIPSNPINFWIYEPQGDYDKAPVKAG